MSEEKEKPEVLDGELVTQPPQPQGIVRVQGDVVAALAEYQNLQSQLDKTMVDSTMKIQGKLYRKKSYWRAVATAFNLDVDLLGEQQIKSPANDEDWGWIVTYSARAKNGRYALGDGACFISEKQGKMRTVHNVRAHAHTRGFNRAVSNLVGFGEVSAEEMVHDRAEPTQEYQVKFDPKGDSKQEVLHAVESPEGGPMTAPQNAKIQATITALAEKKNTDRKDYFLNLCDILGLKHIESSKQLSKKEASRIIDKLEEIEGGV